MSLSKKESELKESMGEPGRLIIGTIVSVKGTCWRNQKEGDTFILSDTRTSGLCPHLLHVIYPYLISMTFGGSFPDDAANHWPGDRPEFICPDAYNQVRIQLRPQGTPEGRHELYLHEDRYRERGKLTADAEDIAAHKKG